MTSLLSEIKLAAVTGTLRNCPLFMGYPGADLSHIASFAAIKVLSRGDYLFYEGTPVHGFYIVRKGAIKVHRFNLAGKEQVLHVFRPYESIAEETLFSDLGHPANASACEDSQVLVVQKSAFVALIKRQPELALCLLRSMSQHVRILVGLLDDLTLKDVKTRLANWLVQHCPNPDSDEPYSIQLPMSKNMLASELGTASETFSRTLAKLRDLKLLSVEGKAITLLCPMKLVQWLREAGEDSSPSTAPVWGHLPWPRHGRERNLFSAREPELCDQRLSTRDNQLPLAVSYRSKMAATVRRAVKTSLV
ncbi:MAG: Crp/Fnr family transcriptional regulator [Chloroflexi bacterium]|nr:Crp/Fnr family transcriptional regulator [Chloroflexota bacterium]